MSELEWCDQRRTVGYGVDRETFGDHFLNPLASGVFCQPQIRGRRMERTRRKNKQGAKAHAWSIFTAFTTMSLAAAAVALLGSSHGPFESRLTLNSANDVRLESRR